MFQKARSGGLVGRPAMAAAGAGQSLFGKLYTISRKHVVKANVVSWAVFTFLGTGDWTQNTQCLVLALGANLALQGMNQLVDEESDRENKPYLPLPAGTTTRGFLKALVLGVSIVTLGLGIWLWGLFHRRMVYCGVIALLCGLYSLPPVQLKRFPIASSLCILVSRPILFHWMLIEDRLGAGAASSSDAALANAYDVLIVLIVAVCAMKDCYDIDGDRRSGVLTLPMLIGVDACGHLAWACLLAATAAAAVLPVTKALLVVHVVSLFRGRWGSKNEIMASYLSIWNHFYATMAAYLLSGAAVAYGGYPAPELLVNPVAAGWMARLNDVVEPHVVEAGWTLLVLWYVLILKVCALPPGRGTGWAAACTVTALAIALVASPGSRPFVSEETVRRSYNDWTDDGVLEFYWGDHIHLGYYPEGNTLHPNGSHIDFRTAKYDMTTHLFDWGHRVSNRSAGEVGNGGGAPALLDMGCGFGGSTRHLAAAYSLGEAVGITLSDSQVDRARQLTPAGPVRFERMDATNTTFGDGSFDLVWSLEMEPHVRDKAKMVDEMLRVLRPGGLLILGCWNVRDDTRGRPFSADEADLLRFLREEWSHPNFWSIERYEEAFAAHPAVLTARSEDWTVPTYPSWAESVLEGFRRPWGALRAGPRGWYGIARETLGILRMRSAFGSGLMRYGVFAVVKRA